MQTDVSPVMTLEALRTVPLFASLDDEALNTPLGEAAGYFADATGRSFVLHIADELIHHTAEAALLRDLFAGVSVRS